MSLSEKAAKLQKLELILINSIFKTNKLKQIEALAVYLEKSQEFYTELSEMNLEFSKEILELRNKNSQLITLNN